MIKRLMRFFYDLRSRKDIKFHPHTVSVFTLTMGRKFYLERLVKSMQKNFHLPYQHIILNQGIKDPEFVSFLQELERSDQRIKVIHEAENIGINEGCKKCSALCAGEVIIKLDDDMLIVSDDFLENLLAVYNALGEPTVLAAFPVGVIGFTGGVAGRYGHSLVYSKERDLHYAIRWVHYAGGCCLIMPKIAIEKAEPFKDFRGSKGASEHDAVIAGKFRRAGFRIGYLENACVVEHQESTIGQWVRSGAYPVNKKKTGWAIELE